MNEYMSVRNQVCPNRLCPLYGKAMARNVAVHSRKLQRLRCTECKKTWVMHRNDPHYGLRNKLATVQEAMQMMASGWSVRTVAKKLSISASTVQRWKSKFKNFTNS